MRSLLVLIAVLGLCAPAAAAPTATPDLAQPPADALHFTIMSTAGRHGHRPAGRLRRACAWAARA